MSISLRNLIMSLGILGMATSPCLAEDILVATRTLAPGDIVQHEDVMAQAPVRVRPDAVPASRDVTGLEVKRRVTAGQTLTTRDVGQRSVVKANASVNVIWNAGTLSLAMQGRALESGGVGDEIRVLNTTTSRTVRGRITEQGTVEVGGTP